MTEEQKEKLLRAQQQMMRMNGWKTLRKARPYQWPGGPPESEWDGVDVIVAWLKEEEGED